MDRLARYLPASLDVSLDWILSWLTLISLDTRAHEDLGFLVVLPIFVVLTVLYNAVSDLFFGGRSIGKLVLDFRPMSAGGQRPGFAQHAYRFVYKLAGEAFRRDPRTGMPMHDKRAGVTFRSRIVDLPAPPTRRWILRYRHEGQPRVVDVARTPAWRNRGELRIGRDPSWADVAIGDTNVSREHAVLRRRDDAIELVNLSQRSVTRVGARTLGGGASAAVAKRTTLQIGSVQMSLEPH